MNYYIFELFVRDIISYHVFFYTRVPVFSIIALHQTIGPDPIRFH